MARRRNDWRVVRGGRHVDGDDDDDDDDDDNGVVKRISGLQLHF